MLEFLARFPRINGFLSGIVQGIPQGIVLPDMEPWMLSALSLFDKYLVFVICFGLFTPLVLFLLVVAIRGTKRTKVWTVLNKYVNLYDMMFWACLSFSVAALYALDKAGTGKGSGVCALFAASGVGFLIAGFLENRLQTKKNHNS